MLSRFSAIEGGVFDEACRKGPIRRMKSAFLPRPWASCLALLLIVSGCSTTAPSGGREGLSLFSGHKAAPSQKYLDALDGGLVGRTGVKLGDNDTTRALEAEYRALESAPAGQAVLWSGRRANGKVVAAAPYQVGSQNCRQYNHVITMGDKTAEARGAACRDEDGTWTLLD